MNQLLEPYFHELQYTKQESFGKFSRIQWVRKISPIIVSEAFVESTPWDKDGFLCHIRIRFLLRAWEILGNKYKKEPYYCELLDFDLLPGGMMPPGMPGRVWWKKKDISIFKERFHAMDADQNKFTDLDGIEAYLLSALRQPKPAPAISNCLGFLYLEKRDSKNAKMFFEKYLNFNNVVSQKELQVYEKILQWEPP